MPAKYVALPAIRGRVVDSDGHPVSNASIEIVKQRENKAVGTINTKIDGTFDRREESSFVFQFAGADRALTVYSVTAVAGGRKSSTTQVTDGVRRWFIVFYDPPTDRNLGDLAVR